MPLYVWMRFTFQIGFNHREKRFDAAAECTKNVDKVENAKVFPPEPFHYAVERVERKTLPVKMGTREFCFHEVDSNSISSHRSEWRQRRSVCHHPISKCYHSAEHSTLRRRCCTNQSSDSRICQNKNLNVLCANRENMQDTRREIMFPRHENFCRQHEKGEQETIPDLISISVCMTTRAIGNDWWR